MDALFSYASAVCVTGLAVVDIGKDLSFAGQVITLLLFIRFYQDFPPPAAFFHALYNAISAFNNCGYSLFSDSLISYHGDWIVNLTVMGLIVLGGIGFIVQYEVIGRRRGFRKKLTLHSKIVLLTSGILILSGAALFYFFEMDHILKGATWQTQLLASFFQSITPWTAGFNTVDIGSLTNDTILVMIILMLIGASPSSTGGEILVVVGREKDIQQIK